MISRAVVMMASFMNAVPCLFCLLGRLFGTLPVHDGSGELADKKMLSLLIIDVQHGGAAPPGASSWPQSPCCIRATK
jgi:hypothetical protein